MGKTDEKVLEEGIEAIRKESECMNNLVEQLLFLARGDNGRQQLTIVDFSLSDMMREVLSEAEMIDSDHEYIADIRDEVSVSGDVAMLKQTARILCDNAKKYTPKGNSITLRVKYNALGQPAFEVQDMGIGIDEKDIPKIFDRFYRSDSSRTRGTGGTGLGLSIAKWIVDRHGGHFEVISYKDIGTRMTVVLPGNNFCNTTK
ncbi:MAG: HAMP domain-containing histidine kinase [Oscillospiraceae bacterium]|nr:HAMP domain-containing histidine kinase [Oscillospiraceae bacterium]